jgi:hypothetical protein
MLSTALSQAHAAHHNTPQPAYMHRYCSVPGAPTYLLLLLFRLTTKAEATPCWQLTCTFLAVLPWPDPAATTAMPGCSCSGADATREVPGCSSNTRHPADGPSPAADSTASSSCCQVVTLTTVLLLLGVACRADRCVRGSCCRAACSSAVLALMPV